MALLETIKDDFEDGVLAAQWSGSHGGTDEFGGRARIPSGTGYPALATPAEHTLLGSSVLARMYPAGPGTSTTATSEMLVDSPTGGTRIIIVVDMANGNLQFRSDVGYGDASGVTVVYSPTTHAWWRLREASGTVYFETSPDTTTWTIHRQVPTPDWVVTGNNPLIFSTHRDVADAGLYAEIDNVNLAPVTDNAGLDQNVKPWETVTLTGTGTGPWSQVSGTAVTLSGTGSTVTFTAPASMSNQSLVFSYGTDQMTVNVSRSRHGIMHSNGTIKPIRFFVQK